MSDSLARLLPMGRDLLGIVDRVLTQGGVPAGHSVLPLITRYGALPGDALEFVAALQPEVVRTSAARLPTVVDLPQLPATWTGPAADAFAQRWRNLDSRQRALAAHLRETAAYAAAVAEWMDESRARMAWALTQALGCAEAVALKTAGRRLGVAAESLGMPALEVAAESLGVPVLEVPAESLGVPALEVVSAAAVIGRSILASVRPFDVDAWSMRLSDGAEPAWSYMGGDLAGSYSTGNTRSSGGFTL